MALFVDVQIGGIIHIGNKYVKSLHKYADGSARIAIEPLGIKVDVAVGGTTQLGDGRALRLQSKCGSTTRFKIFAPKEDAIFVNKAG